MEPIYRPILKRAWQLVKKYPFIWPLGFLVAFLGNASDYKFFQDLTSNISDNPQLLSNLKDYFNWPELINFITSLSDKSIAIKLTASLIFFFSVVFVVGIIWLIVAAEGALINAVNDLENNKNNGFFYNLKIGSKFSLPIFWLNAIAKLSGFILLIFIIIPLLTIWQTQQWFMMILFLIFLPAVIILNFITKYACAYAVLQGKKTGSAFIAGWNLFIKNWLVSLEVALMILIVNIFVFFALAILAIIIISPFFSYLIITGNVASFTVFLSNFFILILLILAIIGSFLAAWQTSAWTLVFLKISKEKIYSKLERLTMDYTKQIAEIKK